MSILFITSTHIGDAILSTGLLNQLLNDFPDESVTIACGAPAAKIFGAVPRLERIHTLRKRRHSLHWFDLWRSAVGKRWRIVVDLRRTLLPYFLSAQERFTLPNSRSAVHRVDLISSTLASPPLAPIMWTNQQHERRARDLIGDDRDVIALAPGATWQGKIWPTKNFVELAHLLLGPAGLMEGYRMILIGAEGEREAAQPLLDSFPRSRVIDAMGLDVLSTSAVLERCQLFVGNDSAMMHLAAATGRPTVGLFGPTRDDHYAPWGKNGLVVRTPESVEELIGHSDYDTRTASTMMANLTAETVEKAIRGRWGNELSN